MEKRWARILISCLGAGMVSECSNISTGKEAHPLIFLIVIITLYFILTAINNSINGSKRKIKLKKDDSDVIDDI